MSPTLRSFVRGAAGAAFLLAFALPASAQNYEAMIQQGMNRMNQIVNQAQQGAQQIVQQRMHDPQVQASYRQYLMQMQASGQRPMDFPTYTYQYVYTNGFSQAGIAHMRANEASNQQKEYAAAMRLREAQANRANAMQQQRDSYFANQQEAGRQLAGQSTYRASNGASVVLPHTWQANTVHDWQGQRYGVDAGGRYHVLGGDGFWYPLAR